MGSSIASTPPGSSPAMPCAEAIGATAPGGMPCQLAGEGSPAGTIPLGGGGMGIMLPCEGHMYCGTLAPGGRPIMGPGTTGARIRMLVDVGDTDMTGAPTVIMPSVEGGVIWGGGTHTHTIYKGAGHAFLTCEGLTLGSVSV
eukprot:8798363-Pyramimonas_sp.AAC.1